VFQEIVINTPPPTTTAPEQQTFDAEMSVS